MISKIFNERFGAPPEHLVKSPGRINVIGEHTDYNEGFVLPAAIDRFAFVAAGRTGSNRVSLYSRKFDELVEMDISEIRPVKGSWTNYILGVVSELISQGHDVRGFNMVLDGNIPVGAGLSSSAAIESAAGYALDKLFGLNLGKLELARAGQMAEHHFAGVKVGIMDEFASIFGKKDHAIKLDCRSLEYEEVPLHLEGHKIVMLNTNVEHSLASSEYNTRRAECAEGVARVQQHVPGITSLRDVTTDMLEKYVRDPLIKKRCRYVLEENQRVHDAVREMRAGNIAGLGRLLFRSHQGLSTEYEVSCRELDYLVETVKDNPAVAGARMMGGGFGGCTINIVKEDAVEQLAGEISEKYFREMDLRLGVYEVLTADGTSEFFE